MAREPFYAENRHGRLQDVSGNQRVGFEDTFLGDLLGFDGSFGVQGPGMRDSFSGARRRAAVEVLQNQGAPMTEQNVQRVLDSGVLDTSPAAPVTSAQEAATSTPAPAADASQGGAQTADASTPRPMPRPERPAEAPAADSDSDSADGTDTAPEVQTTVKTPEQAEAERLGVDGERAADVFIEEGLPAALNTANPVAFVGSWIGRNLGDKAENIAPFLDRLEQSVTPALRRELVNPLRRRLGLEPIEPNVSPDQMPTTYLPEFLGGTPEDDPAAANVFGTPRNDISAPAAPQAPAVSGNAPLASRSGGDPATMPIDTPLTPATPQAPAAPGQVPNVEQNTLPPMFTGGNAVPIPGLVNQQTGDYFALEDGIPVMIYANGGRQALSQQEFEAMTGMPLISAYNAVQNTMGGPRTAGGA